MTLDAPRLIEVGGDLPAQRLKIAVLSRVFSKSGGGAERYSVSLVEQLAETHDICVFAQEIGHNFSGVSYYRIPMVSVRPRWMNQWWFAAATWWATRKGFDVVHSHENTWHGSVQTVHVLPVKHNLFHQRNGWKFALRCFKVVLSPRLLAYLTLEALRYADRRGKQIVVTSQSLEAVMAATYPEIRHKLSVITPGITMPDLSALPAKRVEARALLGLPATGRCLLFVANDFQKKGLSVLLEVMSRLPEDVVLAVAGDSAQLPRFQRKAVKTGLSARVFFIGSQKSLASSYYAADCLVHPTTEDTFAMVVLEAMSYGLPVVVSGPAQCGIACLLTHGRNAILLSDPQSHVELEQALSVVLNNHKLLATLSAAAVEFAQGFDWRTIAASQDAVYRTVSVSKHGCGKAKKTSCASP